MFRVISALIAAAVIAACSANSVEPRDPMWLLLESPATPDFSEGSLDAPFSRWKQVRKYASHDTCNADLRQEQNDFQNPFECMASDNPRLRKDGANETR
jgi:hypothetical protein